MTKNKCKNITELLIDYADGQLPEDKSLQVERHIKKCNNCRNYLKDLNRSLNIAKEIWQENLAEIENIEIPTPAKISHKTKWKYPAIAAGIMIIAALLTLTTQQNPHEPAMTAEQIEQKISQTASAQRLLATADLLREYKNAEDILKKLYQNIIATYPDTQAAMEAKSRIKTLM